MKHFPRTVRSPKTTMAPQFAFSPTLRLLSLLLVRQNDAAAEKLRGKADQTHVFICFTRDIIFSLIFSLPRRLADARSTAAAMVVRVKASALRHWANRKPGSRAPDHLEGLRGRDSLTHEVVFSQASGACCEISNCGSNGSPCKTIPLILARPINPLFHEAILT